MMEFLQRGGEPGSRLAFLIFIGVLDLCRRSQDRSSSALDHRAIAHQERNSTRRGSLRERSRRRCSPTIRRRQQRGRAARPPRDRRRGQGRGPARRRRSRMPRWKSSSPAAPSSPRPRSAQAEVQAVADVGAAAAEAAVTAAEKILTPDRQGRHRRKLDRAQASQDVKAKLN